MAVIEAPRGGLGRTGGPTWRHDRSVSTGRRGGGEFCPPAGQAVRREAAFLVVDFVVLAAFVALVASAAVDFDVDLAAADVFFAALVRDAGALFFAAFFAAGARPEARFAVDRFAGADSSASSAGSSAGSARSALASVAGAAAWPRPARAASTERCRAAIRSTT